MFRNIRTGVTTLAALAAVAVGASAIATAASNSGSNSGTKNGASSGTSTPQNAPGADARQGTQPGHGPNETLLTDGTANKVEQAALGKVPGATVLRVETDSEGSPYEAHLQKSDGSQVTVKVDKQFKATAVESGFGSGPPRGGTSAPGGSSAPPGSSSY
jgi:hypothetical protein